MPVLDRQAPPLHVLHIIVGLDVGGAETALSRLVMHQHLHAGVRHTVVSLTTLGKIGERLRVQGLTVHAIGASRYTFWPLAPWWLWCLVRAIRRHRPDIVQTWIYHANLLGGIAARLSGVRNIIWGIRGTLIPQGRMSSTQIVVAASALFSKWLPHTIVCCAEAAKAVHVASGYDATKMIVIPNGFDVNALTPPSGSRQGLRSELGITPQIILIGAVGRFDPLKDYPNFFAAASVVRDVIGARVRFLVAGRGCDWSNPAIATLAHRWGLSEKDVLLLGERNDVPSLLAALDIFCLSSKAEGFPNVLCEAMACGTLVVTTNVGDASEIVDGVGECVPRQNADALARSLIRTARHAEPVKNKLKLAARQRVENKYDLSAISNQWARLYGTIACRRD